MKKAIIYLLRDPMNMNVRYIGKSSKRNNRNRNIFITNVEEILSHRLKEHIKDSKGIMNGTTKRRKNSKKHSWIISLLKQNIIPTIELIEEVEYELWEEREMYWIQYYKDQGCDLVNMTNGGDGGPVTLGMKFGPAPAERKKRISDSLKISMNAPHCIEMSKRNIKIAHSKILIDGKLREDILPKISSGTKLWWDENRDKNLEAIRRKTNKPVICYSPDQSIIKEYSSMTDAESDGFSISMISQVCTGRRKSHKGLLWRFKNNADKKSKVYRLPVICYTIDGNLIKEYPSIASVKNDGFNISVVRAICYKIKGAKSHKGFLWKFKDIS